MSTPTAIEIVRECHAWRRGEGKYAADGFMPPLNIPPPYWMCQESAALAAVLADAERFQALERAHDGCTGAQWCSRYGTTYINSSEVLAELADKLRSETP
jgi:hypothetical protein